jgi:hypothetical protein
MSDDDALCLSCNHPKSEHGDKGCMHLEPLPHSHMETLRNRGASATNLDVDLVRDFRSDK